MPPVHYLLASTDYKPMFKPIIDRAVQTHGFDEVPSKILTQIEWAKRTLKRQDRIIWYLRLYRWVLVCYCAKKDHSFEPLEQRYMHDLAAKAPGVLPAFDAQDLTRVSSHLEHYLSQNIPPIEQIIFQAQVPQDLLYQMEGVEREWQQQWGKLILPQPDDKIVLQFADGWAWWLLPRAYCEDESRAMGHCGNSPQRGNANQQILSLREPKRVGTETRWEPHCTFIYHIKNKAIGEMKGKGNAKPVARYHPYIVELLKLPMIQEVVGGGYRPGHNFKLYDLSPELRKDLAEARPDILANVDANVTVQHIIDSLELGPDAWLPDEEKFVVERWTTGYDFLRSNTEYQGRSVVDLATGVDKPDEPKISDLMEMITERQKKGVYSWAGNMRVKDNPDFEVNICCRMLYEYPQYAPDGFDPDTCNRDEMEEFLEKLLDMYDQREARKQKNRRHSVISDLVECYSYTTPQQYDAESECNSAMEYIEENDLEHNMELDTDGLAGEVRLLLPLDDAREIADEIDNGGRTPDWTKDINVSLSMDIYDSNANSDYLNEKFSEFFADRPAKPSTAPKGQRRLFPFPRTEESAKRQGITISRLLEPCVR